MRRAGGWTAAGLGLCLWAGMAGAATVEGDRCWRGSWASSQQIPEEHNALPDAALDDATLRQVVRTSIGGDRLRIRVSNLFGTEPLRFRAARVALSADPASPRIVPGSDRPVTFGGRDSILVPAGAEYVSDPVDLAVGANAHVTVSLHLPEAPARQTSHPGSRATSYTLAGDHTAAADLPGAATATHWYQLAALDVVTDCNARAVVTFGDSITDGFGVQPDSDTRWPDFLARRLQADAATSHVAVLNHGIGGNRILRDGLGPNALARFDRDVLLQTGANAAILLIGVNDLGTASRDGLSGEAAHRALVAEMIGALAQMVARGRERGIRMIGATIIPFGSSEYYHPDAAIESDRQAINAWIRTTGNFDAVVDFDALLRDPAEPSRMSADFDSGDGLHPSIGGYEAMAGAVDVRLLTGE